MDCLSRWKYGLIRFEFLPFSALKILFFLIVLDVQEHQIGTKILTRSLTNEFQPEDLTENYKNPTKSSDEQIQSKNDVEMKLKLPDDIKVSFLSSRKSLIDLIF